MDIYSKIQINQKIISFEKKKTSWNILWYCEGILTIEIEINIYSTYLTVEDMVLAFLNGRIYFHNKDSIADIDKIVHRPIINVVINIRRHAIEFIFNPIQRRNKKSCK